jgi:RNA polymerase sigma factor (sigma-70 family)
VSFEEVDTRNPLIDADCSPEEALEAEQRLGHIRALLDAVSRRTRDIYFAHRAGYSYAEISEHMGISHITIKRHIARGLLAIMEGGEPDDGIANRATE